MSAAQPASSEGEGKAVLVVDDEAVTLKVLETALKKRGYDVTTANSSSDALGLLNKNSYDIVIADIVMPDMDGFAFLAEVRKTPDTATVPFIFLTGDRTVKNKVKGLELGVDEYITKPCVIDELYARMAAILRRREVAVASAAPPGSPTEGWDLSGKLSTMPPSELIQSLASNQKTGVLRLTTRFGRGELFLDKGHPVHATFEGIDGEEAVYLMFALDDGTFDFRSGVKATVKTLNANTSSLLLEGMRRMDETRAIFVARDAALRRAGQ
jgi:DNA-binding response OmpR family regulator